MKWVVREYRTNRIACIVTDEQRQDGCLDIIPYGNFVVDEYNNGFEPMFKIYDDTDMILEENCFRISNLKYLEDDYE